MIIVGRTPGDAIVLSSYAHAHPDLVGYIEQTSRELLAVAELELKQEGKVHASMKELLFTLWKQYDAALDQGCKPGEGLDGDMRLLARFKSILDPSRKEIIGRPFSKNEGRKIGETRLDNLGPAYS